MDLLLMLRLVSTKGPRNEALASVLAGVLMKRV